MTALTLDSVAERVTGFGRRFLAASGARLLPVGAARRLRVVEAMHLGPGARLAIVRFGERDLLVSVTKSGVQLLAEDPA